MNAVAVGGAGDTAAAPEGMCAHCIHRDPAKDTEPPELKDAENIVVDVRGRKFSIPRFMLGMHRNTMLGAMFSEEHSDTLEVKDSYFFDRDPKVFQSVYNYYMTGVLTAPEDVPMPIVMFEWDFWGLHAPPLPSILTAEQQSLTTTRANTAVEAFLDVVRSHLTCVAMGELPQLVFCSQVWSKRWCEVASKTHARMAFVQADQITQTEDESWFDSIDSETEGIVASDADVWYRQKRNIRTICNRLERPLGPSAVETQWTLLQMYQNTLVLANCKLAQHLLQRALLRLGFQVEINPAVFRPTERPADLCTESISYCNWVVGWCEHYRYFDASGYYAPLPLGGTASGTGRHMRLLTITISTLM